MSEYDIGILHSCASPFWQQHNMDCSVAWFPTRGLTVFLILAMVTKAGPRNPPPPTRRAPNWKNHIWPDLGQIWHSQIWQFSTWAGGLRAVPRRHTQSSNDANKKCTSGHAVHDARGSTALHMVTATRPPNRITNIYNEPLWPSAVMERPVLLLVAGLLVLVSSLDLETLDQDMGSNEVGEWEGHKYLQANNVNYTSVQRDGKIFFFPLFSVVRFQNTQCTGSNNLNGTCYTRRECTSYGGTASGSCSSGLGTCCVVTKTCGTSTRVNCTYFVNPSYPSYYTDGGRCTITINKCNSNICQLRIDFIDFSIAQPDATGACTTDFMTVTGSASTVPTICGDNTGEHSEYLSTVPVICGDNTGEHIYVNFASGSTPIEITITTSTTDTSNRRWNLKLSQLECDCPWLAPVGCLMYYTDITGTVKSFNYGLTASTTAFGTRELVNLNYGVCVRMAEGYCSIQWSQSSSSLYTFTISGDTGGLDTTVLGATLVLLATADAQLTGTSCTTDFIVIPNPYQGGVSVNSDRFCGNGLVTTTTSSKPFVLTVVTDADETSGATPDNENRGFCLTYTQLACTT
uniref:CUB domain-containing protein n=1 Tax=Timema shepardi TaxID=629360 RepID=A0A7R9AQT2_TIMSH|nr:unnamed protein product [Timema shepardi]